jgi:hypothetical protein
LMQQKRKRQLEEQLEDKLAIQRQYTNPRGIGQRGGPVANPKDLEQLNEQIESIRRQLAEIMGGGYQNSQQGSMPPTPHSQVATPHYSPPPPQQQQQQQQQPYNSNSNANNQYPQQQQQPQQYTPQPGLHTPSGHGANVFQPQAGGAPPSRGPQGTPLAQTSGRPNPPGSASGQQSKREQVWNAKYQRWLTREREASRQSSRAGGAPIPALTGGPMPGSGWSPVAVDTPHRDSGFSPSAQSSGMPPQDQVRYGRRATPPMEAARPPVMPMQAQNFNTPGHPGNNPRGGFPPHQQPAYLQQQQQQQPTPFQQQQQQPQQAGFNQQQQQQQQQQGRLGRRGNQGGGGLW